ncbi:hypothetical protein EYC59_02850 [Candidatus Saccharibacteria bacterium]|nr:MAG: hypothetical protein EYC59_02850 [Candidatus Saccharibacteria bacterium]
MATSRDTEKYFGNNRASKAIYGALLLFVFIAGVAHTGGAAALPMALKTFVAALTIIFAEIYSEFIGERIKNRGRLSKAERRGIVSDTGAIASVSFWPSLIFLVSATGLYSIKNAFIFALVYLLAVLLAFSYLAARMSGMGKPRAFLVAAVTLVIGGAVIALKYKFGH